MKRHSDLCRQLVFANIIMIHVIMAIVLFHGLVRPVRMLAWIGGLLTALVVVFDILIDVHAKCKYCKSPLKKSRGSRNPPWDLYNAIWSGKLICPVCGRNLSARARDCGGDGKTV